MLAGCQCDWQGANSTEGGSGSGGERSNIFSTINTCDSKHIVAVSRVIILLAFFSCFYRLPLKRKILVLTNTSMAVDSRLCRFECKDTLHKISWLFLHKMCFCQNMQTFFDMNINATDLIYKVESQHALCIDRFWYKIPNIITLMSVFQLIYQLLIYANLCKMATIHYT